MNPSRIDSIDSARRSTTVERAGQSPQLEGGRSSRQARALQRRWVDGELTYAEFGAEPDLLRPTVDRRR